MMDELMVERAKLCDLLIGRSYRAHAAKLLEGAFYLLEHGHPDFVLDALIDQAAHIEWIASLAEQGRIRFGGRLNRCGYQGDGEDV